ncbi:MAG: AMP-binding protein [Gammaproteobacteria bacterium]|nr:AMP-binding protein [Gammaproteobacteria bacterium]
MQSASSLVQTVESTSPNLSDANLTLVQLVARNANQHGAGIAFREKELGLWKEYNWQDYLDNVTCLAAGLESLGFQPGDTLMVMGDNRPKLYWAMIAAGGLRGKAMPVYPDAAPDEVLHFCKLSQLRFVIAEDQEQIDKLLDLREEIGTIEHVIYVKPRGMRSYQVPGLVGYDELIERGRQRLDADAQLRDSIINRSRPEDPAIYLHSSGTTGLPKAIVIQNRRILSGVLSAYEGERFRLHEEIIAYLPMAWVGDFALTVAAAIALRFTVNIPEGQETVLRDMREAAPTFYLAAPRSWDNMLTTMQVRMQESTPIKKWLYDFFMGLALEREKRRFNSEEPTIIQKLLKPIGEIMVYGPIKDNFGLSRVKNAFTGGEAMGEDTFLFYRALGIRLMQLYGQTESSAFTSTHQADEIRLHTVGKPLPGVEVKISESGEILVRSNSVFDGYQGNEKATNETLVDGWLHTGDAGYLEEDGHLVVLGRVSEVVYTATGERYIPNYIENRIKFDPIIKDVAVFGRDRDYLTALVCIDLDSVGNWAEQHGVSYISYADLSQKPEVLEQAQKALEHVNDVLPEALKIKRFANLHKEFDPDDGEITRTRKLRRKVVEERYQPIIDALYGGQLDVTMRAQVTYDTGESGSIERILAIKDLNR